MARLPNGALVVSGRTEKMTHTALGQLIAMAQVMRGNAIYNPGDREYLAEQLKLLKKLREKFNGK